MKSLITIMISCSLLMGCVPMGQGVVHPSPPGWAYGWHAGITYYYFPDWGIYYDVYRDYWIWYDGIIWVRRPSPPHWCAQANFYRAYHVPMRYSGRSPHTHHREHISKFPPKVATKYRGPSRGHIRKSRPPEKQPPASMRKRESIWNGQHDRGSKEQKREVSPKRQAPKEIHKRHPASRPSKGKIQHRNPRSGKEQLKGDDRGSRKEKHR